MTAPIKAAGFIAATPARPAIAKAIIPTAIAILINASVFIAKLRALPQDLTWFLSSSMKAPVLSRILFAFCNGAASVSIAFAKLVIVSATPLRTINDPTIGAMATAALPTLSRNSLILFTMFSAGPWIELPNSPALPAIVSLMPLNISTTP